jgi:hypothetical protein
LGWEAFEARRRVHAAEQVCPRIGLDGTELPARLAATAAVFASGQARLRHVEVIARLLDSPAARRLAPHRWTGAEATLAAKATEFTPSGLQTWGAELIEKLDEDGPEPDDRPPTPVNELHLLPHRGRPGGQLKGRFDDPALYDAIATLIDAKAAPRTGDDQRSAAQRQAEALAEVCGYVLDHGDVPDTGGRRPHLNVIISLEDLEARAKAAMLDFGGRLSPEALRLLACDAAVVPIVMNGAGQPLDVGRARRTIPDGLRRAVAARDRGCARCGPTVVVRGAPHRAVGGRRGDQAEQLRHALQDLSPPDPFHRLAGPPPRRPPGIHPTGLDRPGPTSPPKTAAPPHHRLSGRSRLIIERLLPRRRRARGRRNAPRSPPRPLPRPDQGRTSILAAGMVRRRGRARTPQRPRGRSAGTARSRR